MEAQIKVVEFDWLEGSRGHSGEIHEKELSLAKLENRMLLNVASVQGDRWRLGGSDSSDRLTVGSNCHKVEERARKKILWAAENVSQLTSIFPEPCRKMEDALES